MPKRSSRRMKGDGGLYQRASGLWVGSVDLGWVDGRRRRKEVSSMDQATALRKLRDERKRIDDHGIATDRHTTVEEWLRHWLSDIAAPRTKPRTMQGYRTTVTQHLIPHLGRKRLDQLQPQHVRELHRALAKAGLAPATALKAHRVLAKALTDAGREGRVARNVATLVDAPSSAAEVERVPLTVDQAKSLLLSLVRSEDPLGSRWAAALLLGARQGECLGLTWDRVDLTEGTADVSWQLQRLGFRHGCGPAPAVKDDPWSCGVRRPGSCSSRELDVPVGFRFTQLDGGLCLTPPKGKPRLVPLPAPMLAFLVEHQARTRGSGLVWTRPDGRPIDPSHDNAAWHAALERAGLPASIDLHSARHTTASLLLDLDVDPYVIQQILGHANVLTTRGYQHVSLALSRKALDDLARHLAIEG